jgi:ABC-2 type transport system ATP-binding protein
MIEVKNLTKRYGPHVAVDDVSFSIGEDEIVGFLGPNGAGKSTTMNILTGYLSMTEGDVTIDDKDILEYPEQIKSMMGYLPESPPLYPDMTVSEYLRFVGELKKVPGREIKERMDRAMETVKITDVQGRLNKNLSKGYRQRVGLAQALMNNPEILILDEPTSGLDPKQIIEIRDLIRELGQDHTIILSSHILPEVSQICERVMIMHDGKIVADGNPATLAQELFDASKVVLTVEGDRGDVEKALGKISAIQKIVPMESTDPNSVELAIEAEKGQDIRRDIFLAMSGAKLPILQMRAQNMTLEEIFLHLTSGSTEVTQ